MSKNYTCRQILTKEQENDLIDFLVYRDVSHCCVIFSRLPKKKKSEENNMKNKYSNIEKNNSFH